MSEIFSSPSLGGVFSSNGIRSRSVRSTNSGSVGRASRSTRSSNKSRRSFSSQVQRRVTRALANKGKNHAPHLPSFPNVSCPTPLVLEPFPSSNITAITVAGDVLVMCHRSGVRLYRQRLLQVDSGSSCEAPPVTTLTTGIWDLSEKRDALHLKDAYLCCGVAPLLSGDHLRTLPSARYFAVAAGNDRIGHSVCVMSTAAHFNLHHAVHKRNKVRCLQLAHIALLPLQERDLTLFAVSVDELGEVVVMDVERDAAVRLEKRVSMPSLYTRKNSRTSGDTGDGGEAKSIDKENYEHSVLRMLQCPPRDSETYRLEYGAATSVALVGPCMELCNRCQNPFSSVPISSPSRIAVMSLYVCSRARDVESETDIGCGSSAEMHVTLVRFLWTPTRAVVLNETTVVRETAPADICEAGIALCARPYHVGIPMTVLVARPRLRVWKLAACTGQLLTRQQIYHDAQGSGHGSRSVQESFIRMIPLGIQSVEPDHGRLWDCWVAVADDDSVLLLGRPPETTASEDAADKNSVAAPSEALAHELEDKHRLETWLDDVAELHAVGDRVSASAHEQKPARSSHEAPLPLEYYTVLVQLYTPHHGIAVEAMRGDTGKTRSPTMGLLEVLPNLPHSELLVLLADGVTILSLRLPFVVPIVSPPSRVDSTALSGAATERGGDLRYTTGTEGSSAPFTLRVASNAAIKAGTGMCQSAVQLSSWNSWGKGWVPLFKTTSESKGTPLTTRMLSSIGGTDGEYRMSIVRPLASAMLRLAGDSTFGEPEDHTNTNGLHSDPLQPLTNGRPLLASPEAGIHETQTCEVSEPKSNYKQKSIDAEEQRENESKFTRPVEAAYVQLRNTGAVKRRSHERSVSERSQQDPHRPLEDVNSQREAYLMKQVEQAVGEKNCPPSLCGQITGCPFATTEMHGKEILVHQLHKDEALQRNAIIYAWGDSHNELYIQLSEELCDLADADIRRATAHVQNATHRANRPHYVVTDIVRGCHSAGFLQQFKALRERRYAHRDAKGSLDFCRYFASLRIPQQVADLQELDRCKFELADLHIVHRRELEQVQVFNTVVVYQNEEVVISVSDSNSRVRRRWVAHRTFPVDDASGNVVDLHAWNSLACASRASCCEWRWATEQDEMDEKARPGKVRVLTRELKDWEVGEWMYASRWPTHEETLRGDFAWKMNDDPSCTVRRRPLRRRRVNRKAEASRATLLAQHAMQLEQLRLELGL